MTTSPRDNFATAAASSYKKRPPEELALFHRIVEGCDADALGVFFNERRNSLVHFSSKYCRFRDLAPDLVMDAVLKVLELQTKKREGEDSAFCTDYRYFDTWVHSLIKNMSLNFSSLASHARIQGGYDTASEAPLDGGGYGQSYVPDSGLFNAFGEVSDGFEDPLFYHLKHEREAAISRTLTDVLNQAQDSTDLQAAVMFGEGDSYSTIAETTRVPAGTVRSRIHRARKNLPSGQLLCLEAV